MQESARKGKARMVRKQVFITPEQNRQLKLRAKATGKPEGELIRSAIDRELETGVEDDGWRDALLALVGTIEDGDGLEARILEHRESWNARVGETGRKLRGED